MNTIQLLTARNKGRILTDFLDGLSYLPSPLQSYHAAQAVKNGNLRVGIERRLDAVKKATKAFNCSVSIMPDYRGIPAIRLYSAIKQTEIWL